MRHPQAGKPNEHAANTDNAEFDSFTKSVGPAVRSKRPVPIADPVQDDGDGGRDNLGDHGALVQHIRRQHGDAQKIEDPDIHDEADPAHHAEAQQLRHERFHETSVGHIRDAQR